jgi:hypothetical protein
MNLGKAGKIIQSHINELPVDEQWYQDRISICNSCPFNTKTTTEKGPLISAMLSKVGVINSEYCVACGCPIKNKASVKSEACGLVKRGEEPKWFPMEVDSLVLKGCFLKNTEPEKYRIEDGVDHFILRPKPSHKEKIEVNTEMFVPKEYSLSRAEVSCGCVVTTAKRIDENNYGVNIKVSTLAFEKGQEDTKKIYFTFTNGGIVKKVSIKLKMVRL